MPASSQSRRCDPLASESLQDHDRLTASAAELTASGHYPRLAELALLPPVPDPDKIVRTPNGGDYGKNLLQQHYEQRH